MGGRHGFKFRQSPGNCVHAGAGSYIDQKLPMRRSGVLRSKPGAATSKSWRRDMTINHQNLWQNRHKTDRTLHRIPQGKNRLQKNIVRSHHKRMCAAIMLTLKNLCNIYEFDFIWSILKKPFNVMRNILDDCNDMFAALRATAVLRQLFTWYLKKTYTWYLPILGHHHTILYKLYTFRHWFFLVLPLNDMHDVQVDSYDMFAALRATAVPRQLDIAGFWAAYCISRTRILSTCSFLIPFI